MRSVLDMFNSHDKRFLDIPLGMNDICYGIFKKAIQRCVSINQDTHTGSSGFHNYHLFSALCISMRF